MRCARTLALAAVFSASFAAAQAQASVAIELNKLLPRDGACEAYLVVRNPGDLELDTLQLDVVLFDPDGVIARRLAVEAGPVRPGKTSVRAFLVEGLSCEAAGSVLLNDVVACSGPDGPRRDCLDLLDVDARPGLDFGM
jgi:hypothetical protein